MVTNATPQTVARWYAVQTRSHAELAVFDTLTTKGLEAFLPRYRYRSRRKDRLAYVEQALFPGYLFVHSTLARTDRIEIRKTPGVARIIAFNDAYTPIPDDEIESLQKVVHFGSDVQPHPFVREGCRVRVVAGALAGVEGFVTRAHDGKPRIVVSISLLSRSVSIQLEREVLDLVA